MQLSVLQSRDSRLQASKLSRLAKPFATSASFGIPPLSSGVANAVNAVVLRLSCVLLPKSVRLANGSYFIAPNVQNMNFYAILQPAKIQLLLANLSDSSKNAEKLENLSTSLSNRYLISSTVDLFENIFFIV